MPYAFKDLSDDLTFTRHVSVIKQAETENHVLNIVTYDYLITNWVMWQGGLPASSRRRYQKMSDLKGFKQAAWNSDAADVYERALRVTGRVMHSGMYEVNSRPYGRVALSALLALANFGDPFEGSPPDVQGFEAADVKRAARNAVDYLAAKFTYQSMRGKRAAPLRRGNEYRNVIDFYTHDSFVVMMSLLSGAYEWNDCTEDTKIIGGINDGRWACPILRWNNTFTKGSAYAVMASSAVGGYRIPKIIHEQMFERGPFYARVKARYTRDHMSIDPPIPEYFVSDTQAFNSGEDRSTFELYFGDDNILLSAGGSHISYYGGAKNDTYAKPTTLIPRGDFGHPGEGDDHWEWRICTENRTGDHTNDAMDDVLMARGKVWYWWTSECNVWLYRNFVYGYRFHDRGLTDANLAKPRFSRQHTFEVPPFWGDPDDPTGAANRIVSFKIGDAHFEIYQFDGPEKLTPEHAIKNLPIGGDGYYIVRARFRKYAAKNGAYRRHREFSRGFLEIIPRHYFLDATLLQSAIEFWNEEWQFSGRHRNDPWIYVMTMGKERVTMDSRMGSNSAGGETCREGILNIREYNWNTGLWDPPIDMVQQFIPRDVKDSNAKKLVPLITVWQLDSSFKSTGCKLVETVDDGSIVIRRPGEICWNWDLSSLPQVCKSWGPGWHCLKLDSHNYTQPARLPDAPYEYDDEDGYVESYDCHCFEP